LNARNRIIYQLVKQAKISHKEAWLALASGQVSLNAKICTDNELVNDYDSLFWATHALSTEIGIAILSFTNRWV